MVWAGLRGCPAGYSGGVRAGPWPARDRPSRRGSAGHGWDNFLAGTLRATISGHHDATLFFGERRGGQACTAGTCYEVQPLEGVELRLLSRF